MFQKKNQKSPERTARTRQPNIERGVGTSVFSYHASRSARPGNTASRRQDPAVEAPAKRAKRNYRLLLVRRSRVVVAMVVVAAALVVNLFLSRTPAIVAVTNDKNQIFLQDKTVYQEAATRIVQQSLLNGNKLTINTAGIQQEMRTAFPELADVHVSVPFAGNTVQVYIEPAMPALLLTAGPEVFVLDDAGRAVMKATQATNIEKAKLPVVNDESNLAIVAGKPALPSTNVAFITEVVAQLRAKGVEISSLTLPAGISELDMRITGENYFVKFNLQGNAREEAGTYLAVKGQLERDKKKPADYIDVRVEERAYYK